MIGVLLGVESSKQPWSKAAAQKARDASSFLPALGWRGVGGNPRDERNPQRGDAEGSPRKANTAGRPLEPLGENC